MKIARVLVSVTLLASSLALAEQAVPASAQQSAQPSDAAPATPPPAPPDQLPPLPEEAQSAEAAAGSAAPSVQVAAPLSPAPQTPPGAASPGQWLYTAQYGWIWMPYASRYVYDPIYDGGRPYAFVYGARLGWRWVVSPWVWGWGPRPFFGPVGWRHYGWYRPTFHWATPVRGMYRVAPGRVVVRTHNGPRGGVRLKSSVRVHRASGGHGHGRHR